MKSALTALRLNARIALLVSTILVVAGVTSGWITAKIQSEGMLSALKDYTGAMARNLSDQCAWFMVVGDYAGLEELLLRTAELPEVRRLQVCEPDGTIIGDVLSAPGSRPRSDVKPQKLVPPPEGEPSIKITGEFLTVWHPVKAGAPMGWLRAEFDMTDFRATQKRAALRNLAVTLLWTGMSAGLIFALLLPTVRTIEKMADFARDLGERRGDQIEIDHDTPEIVELGQALNFASQRLFDAERELTAEKEAVIHSYSTIRGIVENTDSPIFSIDPRYRYTAFNTHHAEVMFALYGVRIEVGMSLLDCMTVEKDREEAKENLDRALTGERHTKSAWSGKGSRSKRYFEVAHNPVRSSNGEVIGVAVIASDTTERMAAEVSLKRLNRELLAISDCNQAMLHAEDEAHLLSEVCRIFRDRAGYAAVWVAFLTTPAGEESTPIASAGLDGDELGKLKALRCLADSALAAGETVCVQDFAAGEASSPLNAAMREHGYNSGASFLLRVKEGGTLGVLTLLSDTSGIFTEEEIRLLEELSGDLAFGIEMLRVRAERQEAEARLTLLNFALDNVREAAFLAREDSTFAYVNEEAGRILGYTTEELLGLKVSDLDPDFPVERWPSHWRELEEQGSITFEGRHRTREGRTFPVEICANHIVYKGVVYNLALVRDITERKEAQEAYQASVARYMELFNKAAVPLCFVNKETGTLIFNTQFEKAFGYTHSDVPTMNEWWKSAYPDPEYRRQVTDACSAALDRAVEAGSDIEPIEYRVTCKNGDIRSVVVYGGFMERELLLTFFDVTERKANLRFLESLDLINRAIQGAEKTDQMMERVLDLVLDLFDCDRAFLLYPCDPASARWSVPMERTKPEYPGALALGVSIETDSGVAGTFRTLLQTDGPVTFGPGTEHPLPGAASERFGFKSFMSMALYPKIGKPWQFGVHQCSMVRRWTEEDARLMRAVGVRLADGLTGMLAYENLRESEERLRKLNESLDQKVMERTAELELSNNRLNRLNRLFVGRELKMIELKKKMRELEKKVD